MMDNVPQQEEGILAALHEISQQIQSVENRISLVEKRLEDINSRSVNIAGRQDQPVPMGTTGR